MERKSERLRDRERERWRLSDRERERISSQSGSPPSTALVLWSDCQQADLVAERERWGAQSRKGGGRGIVEETERQRKGWENPRMEMWKLGSRSQILSHLGLLCLLKILDHWISNLMA